MDVSVSGVPTSLESSGEQWDFPNAWPPLQHILVESLQHMGTEEAKQLAFELAQKWIRTNYLSYVQSQPNAMFEKVTSAACAVPIVDYMAKSNMPRKARWVFPMYQKYQVPFSRCPTRIC